MTTPTTNFGWVKSDPGEYANITVYNTALDAMDASIKSKSDTVGAKIKPMMKWKHIDDVYIVNNVNPYLLRDTSAVLWEELWNAPGNVGGMSFNPQGNMRFTVAGIYRLSYTISTSGLYQTTEGQLVTGLYSVAGSVQVARTGHTAHIQKDTQVYQTISFSTYLKAATSGADVVLYDGTDSTQYAFGILQNTTTGNIITRLSSMQPFFTTFTLEYVRAS